MDTNRIGQFLGLAPKLVRPGENAQSSKSGFADLLLGVMNKRLSTVQPLPPPAKIAGLAPAAPLTPAASLSGDRATSPTPGPRRPEVGKPALAANETAETGSPQVTPTDDADDAAERIQSAGMPASDRDEETVEAASESAETGAPTEQLEMPEESSDGSELPAEEAADETAADHSADESDAHADEPSSEVLPQQVDITTAPAAAVPIQASLASGTDAESRTEEAAADDTAPGSTETVGATDEATPSTDEATPSDDAALDPASTPDTELAADISAAAADENGSVAPSNPEPEPTADIAATAGAALAAASNPQSSETQASETQASANTAAAQGERRAEDTAAVFRRNQSAPRQRPAAAAAGTNATKTAPQAPAAATGLPSGTPGPVAGTPATTLSPIAPLGFDTGFGTGAGLPGWDLHLGQGAALRRPEFFASLRQHLQNLPLHEQVALSVKRAANDGGGRITLQLSPSELGRIHVKLDIDEEKNVRASVAVERPSTLELLQRDLRSLERALQDAGLKTDQHDLSLSLQGGDPDAFARQFGAEGDERGLGRAEEDEAAGNTDVAATPGIVATGDGLVDVRI